MWKDTPRTACTMPSAVRNDTCRSSTSSSATLPTLPGARARTPQSAPVVHSMPLRIGLYSQLAPRDRDRGAPTGTATCRPSASGGAQPDIRRVELLECRHVNRIVHVAGVVQRPQRLRDRVDRRV